MAAEIVVRENLLIKLNHVVETLLPNDVELRTLQQSVRKVEGALLAVEAEERMEDNDAVATHSKIGNLVALVHEADDLLDCICTCANKEQQERMENQQQRGGIGKLAQQVSNFFLTTIHTNQIAFVLPSKVAGNVKKINTRIQELANELDRNFHNTEVAEIGLVENSFSPVKIEVTGRDKDKKQIIKMLLPQPAKNNCTEANVSLIPIVGMQGLGKSALAKLVYEDEKVKNHFDLRIWIQVSHILDEGDIIQEIVETFTTRKSTYQEKSILAKTKHELLFFDLFGCQSFQKSMVTSTSSSGMEMDHRTTGASKTKTNIFESRLRKEINGKLYLLVLDDAHVKQWALLRDILAGGAIGSRVLVTTRSRDVASLANTNTDGVYYLTGLSPKDSWSLFGKQALQQEGFSDGELKKIGESIVTSCKGVPLSIMVAGSLLFGKSTEKWLSLRDDLLYHSEDESLMHHHILEHSYKDLPTRLKACLGYCSLFPQEFDFNKTDLISLWMAQGYVHTEKDGELYLLELARRYFFQDVVVDDLGNILTFKMYPLMRNLACTKAARIIKMHVADNSLGINALDSTCKHVLFGCNSNSSMEIPPSLLQAQGLRTFVYLKEPSCNANLDKSACNMLFSKFKRLRVLDLHDLGIEQLSDSICSLIHLRYLDLSRNDLVTLPSSVTKLYNLQTLKFNSCHKLTTLNGNFGALVSLKRLELDECGSLTYMPLGLEKLTQIEMLCRFVVGKNCSKDRPNSGLKALKELDLLRGRLEIEFTGDWTESIDEGTEAKLNCKSNLAELRINWAKPISDIKCSSSGSDHLSDEDKQQYQNLLENLQPNPNLKILCIEGYKGSDFPTWAGVVTLPSLLPNLVVVSIEGCHKCQNLPPFGKLSQLKCLTLRHMANVLYVENDESSAGSSTGGATSTATSAAFFQSLEQLTLHNFYKLEAWRKDVILTSRHQSPVRCFPRLSKLKIWNCPKLTSMPLFPWVSYLDLRNVNRILLDECANKASMNIPKQPPEYKGIESLQIRRCANLKSFTTVRKGLRHLPCLHQLVIDRCDALTSLGSELRYLSSLKMLEISSCKELDLSDDGIGIHNTDNSSMASWASLRAFHNLIQKTPWASMKSLRHLTLKDIPKMKSLPEGLKYVQTLKFLWLSACYELQELPEWIGTLTMLQHLRIERCPALKRLPDGIKNVKSLVKVEITECPDLMERCRDHKGEDWHKIKHARVLLHKSWRYGLMSEQGASQNSSMSNVKALDDAKYIIMPVIPVVGKSTCELKSHIEVGKVQCGIYR